jgi:hypothetical protein
MNQVSVEINYIEDVNGYEFALAQLKYLAQRYNLKLEENTDITVYCLKLSNIIREFEHNNNLFTPKPNFKL